MELPSAYIPMDRRQAIMWGETLADRTTGAALFADISGFTPLTEALLKAYGPKRGPEELTKQLNQIYDALVSEAHRYGGSVIAFSGDAITCWLDGDDGVRAIACGLAMQQTMGQFAALHIPTGQTIALAMKAAVAAGSVRRFRVGDSKVQYIDVLAGATLDRMAAAEHHAEKGEVVLAPEVAEQITDQVEIAEWRDDHETDRRYGVVGKLSHPDSVLVQEIAPSVQDVDSALAQDQTRPWLLPPVYERLSAGKGGFLAELRPAVALFLSFGGIDYDRDEAAGEKLDAYIQWVQNVLVRYEAFLLQLTIGDKGSYMYAAFGAPIAHEDDAVRAVSAALELQAIPADLNYITDTKIGVSQGQMRTGAYGGTRRRTYGVLGDEVNMAARLMQAAQPGQILIKDSVWDATDNTFAGESIPPFMVKGKSDPVNTYSIIGVRVQQAIHLQEPKYALPMVGREAELALVEQKMDETLAGHGQIVAIVAEAGMGKSRLAAEVIRKASERLLVGYGGECQSYGTNISYLVWQPIWRAFFNLDPSWSLEAQMDELETMLELIDPALVPRMPLLGAVLNLSIPDNDLTRTFDAKLRKTSLESLLVDCLRLSAQAAPLMLVFEDCHWLDPLSHDLLEVIGRAIADLPVLMVMVYRPMQLERLKEARLEKLPYFTEIPLTDFTPQEAKRLISLKLEQFFGDQTDVPAGLLKRITERAQGNPFYIEELLNYLQDQNFDPKDTKQLDQFELPTSLHSLILSRIDQLTEHQKSTIKVASVIGRLFEAAWLWGMYPELGDPVQIKADLEALSTLDLAPMDKPDPELTYIFKHIVTQEVAYESLPYATRSMLHNQLGEYIEQHYQEKLDRFVNLLAHHYHHSENDEKKRIYLRKAGESAQEEYNNEAAVDYFERVLPLLSDEDKVEVMRKLGEVEQLVGRWEEAKNHYEQAVSLAQRHNNASAQGWCEVAMGRLLWRQSQYTDALTRLERARVIFEELGDQAGVGQVWHEEGLVAAVQGNLEEARMLWRRSLKIRQELDDTLNIAHSLNNLALAARNLGDYEESRTLNEQALELRYKLGDKRAIANSLNNFGLMLTDLKEYETARTQLEVAVDLQREIGDKWEIGNALHTLATTLRNEGDYDTARAKYNESLTTLWELGERYMLAYVLEDMGGLSALQGQPERALRLFGAATTLREKTGSSLSPTEQAQLEDMLAPAREALAELADSIEAEGRAMSVEQAVELARSNTI